MMAWSTEYACNAAANPKMFAFDDKSKDEYAGGDVAAVVVDGKADEAEVEEEEEHDGDADNDSVPSAADFNNSKTNEQ